MNGPSKMPSMMYEGICSTTTRKVRSELNGIMEIDLRFLPWTEL